MYITPSINNKITVYISNASEHMFSRHLDGRTKSNNTIKSVYSRLFKCVGSGNSLDENELANKGIIIIMYSRKQRQRATNNNTGGMSAYIILAEVMDVHRELYG